MHTIGGVARRDVGPTGRDGFHPLRRDGNAVIEHLGSIDVRGRACKQTCEGKGRGGGEQRKDEESGD